MKKEIISKARNFTLEVLDFFLGIPEALLHGFDREEFYRQLNGNFHEQQLSCSNIAQFISNLKRHGYIEVKKTSKGESIRFTSKAKLSVIDRLATKNGSDGKFRFVSFDIPEDLRINRDKFRRSIKKMGFKQIQKSLWACNKKVGELVELAAYEYKVGQYVVYIVSEHTDIDGFLNKKFTQ